MSDRVLSGHFPAPHIRTPIYLRAKSLQTHSQLGDIIPNQFYHRKQPGRPRQCSHYKTKWSDKDCPGGSRNYHPDHPSLDVRNLGSRNDDCGCYVQIPCTYQSSVVSVAHGADAGPVAIFWSFLVESGILDIPIEAPKPKVSAIPVTYMKNPHLPTSTPICCFEESLMAVVGLGFVSGNMRRTGIKSRGFRLCAKPTMSGLVRTYHPSFPHAYIPTRFHFLSSCD